MHEFRVGNIQFGSWDVVGRESARHTWEHFIKISDAVVFVVDSSSDAEKFQEAFDEVRKKSLSL